MDVIEILKQFGTQFEHLAFENLNTTQEVLVEIGKLKFLKSLSLKSLNVKNISQSDQHSEMMVGIFQNLITYATQLESIDFEFDSYDPEVTKHYDQLIMEKKDILRKIGLNWSTRVDCGREFGPQCVSYKTINLCTNLEELSGRLHLNEFQNIKTRLKRLSTGEIRNSVEFGMFAKLNRTNLEHIEIVKMQEMWFAYFAQLKFPALRYLMIQFENYSYNRISLIEEDVQTLMKNSPNLKALNFTGKPITISEDFAFNIFDTKGIIISLNDNIQEMADYFYKNQKDYYFFEKFKTMKNLYWKQFSKS